VELKINLDLEGKAACTDHVPKSSLDLERGGIWYCCSERQGCAAIRSDHSYLSSCPEYFKIRCAVFFQKSETASAVHVANSKCVPRPFVSALHNFILEMRPTLLEIRLLAGISTPCSDQPEDIQTTAIFFFPDTNIEKAPFVEGKSTLVTQFANHRVAFGIESIRFSSKIHAGGKSEVRRRSYEDV
jgi:hypothetical protein